MGLYHAKKTIEDFGGKLEIESQEEEGTTTKIILPKAQVPFWFVSELTLIDNHNIVIVDDDESIHAIWKKRFSDYQTKYKKLLNLFHFQDPEKFIKWMHDIKLNDSILYLCDYEFIGSEMNGIDLITKLKINCLSILVTSRAISANVISICEVTGIKLLPKDMANFVPIN